MAQTPALLATLKKQLKAHGKTYADLALALDLSEASVKRLFAEQSFTLQRLEAACAFIGIQLEELVGLMAQEQLQLRQLTEQQEKEIAEDLLLLLVTVSVINGFTMRDLLEQYEISEVECIRKLAHLDRLKIIELLPNNRVKLLVAPNFRWLPNGPIQKFFLEKVQRQFFTSQFDDEDQKLIVLNGILSKASNSELQKKMQRLAREFNELMQSDAGVPMSERFGTTMVMAMRPWEYELFKQYLRSK
ncbi:helix-turn-helix domain-containing protein [Agarilytica rhodophyticola]|uniref:helix-turn-helix domain-containing protein n=1 Tax=Agarilytica rhodophyticola TaxID=1737490 RepID=UPI000B344E64|nr:helix-turn-helix transcriptional regulator [Agarilytica rhodophyticola]